MSIKDIESKGDFMSCPTEIFDKQKQNCLQKCFFMMNLIKNKNLDLWEMYAPVYENLKVEESWEFYHLLIDEYKSILENERPLQASKKKSQRKAA
jgi:hypothetical protein